MVALRCPCERSHELWGELWWAGGQYQWVFFDDLKTSETYSEGASQISPEKRYACLLP
jgi:hypothetical protein